MELEIGADGAMKWERVKPAVWWPSAQAWVVADRHLPDGKRQHMVRGSAPAGLVVASADVIGEADSPKAEFSTRLSHLSTTE
ncbi:MAG: hypothetical protein O9327_03420 [Polaromonas sp.]|nr:hypothetical protein [Polaromonas sp.]